VTRNRDTNHHRVTTAIATVQALSSGLGDSISDARSGVFSAGDYVTSSTSALWGPNDDEVL